jgi:hypothetical protein
MLGISLRKSGVIRCPVEPKKNYGAKVIDDTTLDANLTLVA